MFIETLLNNEKKTTLKMYFYFVLCRDTMDVVKQSAALCFLRLLRTNPDVIPIDSNGASEWTSRIVHLLNDQHLGVVTAAVSLIDALVKRNPKEYKACVSFAVSRLSRVKKKKYIYFKLFVFYVTN